MQKINELQDEKDELVNKVTDIQYQLGDPVKRLEMGAEYDSWRQKAKYALKMALKDLREVKSDLRKMATLEKEIYIEWKAKLADD